MASRHVIGGATIDEANPLAVELAAGHSIDIGTVDQGSAGSTPWPVTDTVTDTLVGAVTETAPVSDIASSGLNGRLQRIAQRLTSILAKLPALGTAGTPSADVLTVQGSPTGTALPVADAGPTNAGTPTYTTSADMTAAASIGPAPTTGQKSVLREVTMSVDTAMSVTLQMQTTPGAERIKVYLPANGTVSLVFRHPRKLGTADKTWQAIASVAGNIAISTVTTSEA